MTQRKKSGLVRWALQKISRERLHKLANTFSPLMAWYYRGDKVIDPIDGRKYRHMLPYGYVHLRENALAPGSLSLERHRGLFLYLRDKTNIFTAPLKLLHVAPEQCFIKTFRKHKNLDYLTADLLSPWADVHFDAHAVPYPNNTFDVIIANHMLEHVQDDMRVLQEFYRVMKPGGWGIFMVPMDENLEKTIENPFLESEEERERLFGQKDHHRMFGRDFAKRLESLGFEVEMVRLGEAMPELDFKKYAVMDWELIPVARKK